jgi:Tfp pilus assembly protein FimT
MAARPASAAGHSLIELVTVVVVVMTMLAIAMPVAQSAYRGFHLTAASAAIGGAIQAARYQAIMNGCPNTLTFSTTATTYQLASELVSGTPPTCAAAYTNVGEALYWSTSGDVSIKSGATTFVLTLNPSGIVTATGGSPTCTSGVGCLVLDNGSSTNTVTVSGVGNVTVTSP